MEIPADTLERLVAFRRELHRWPELGFQEQETSRRVCEQLDALGVDYVTGLAGTGVVAWLQGARGAGAGSVGLRADMDALPLEEHSGVEYASRNPGCMHACGHDGHTTMLLGAIEHLQRYNDFDGTVYFVFQPAEEGVGGGKAMVGDGLFSRFPMDEIYGLHNAPGLPLGRFGIIPGPIMAGGDRVDITIHGQGGHGGMNPHGCIDPVRIAAELIQKAHTIVSREIDPLSPAVLSICAIQSGSLAGFNVIPHTATLAGTMRFLDRATAERLRSSLRALCASLEQYYGARIELAIDDTFAVTVNHPEATEAGIAVIRDSFGDDALQPNHQPSMGSEDFAFMLEACRGAYIHVGAGDETHTHGLHSQQFDFNDRIIPDGIRLLAGLARESLARQGG
ncbi:amidohydrolase [Aquisalimonas sp. APHAB1-3]|uniref:amidohydrolase n=1 Tax=Aquisalimonas sp. APHAB1-3 TaxID=3402080 RepID=UPI003AB0500E